MTTPTRQNEYNLVFREDDPAILQLRARLDALAQEYGCELTYPSTRVPAAGSPPLIRLNRYGQISVEMLVRDVGRLSRLLDAVARL
jgi:hypothetical protein